MSYGRSLPRRRGLPYPTTFRLTLPSSPHTRIYTRLRGDGKGQYIFISWSREYLSKLAKSSIQENHRRSLVVVHFGVILGDSPIVALSDVGNSRLLAVAAVIARDILANTAQEQAHVFRATMMLPTGSLTGVPCCAGAGSRGTEPWRHPTVPPPRGPSAGHQRPSRPFGLRSLTQDAGKNYPTLISSNPFKSADLQD